MLYQDLKLHWDMFCGAIQRWRKGDEGVTTLEMVILGGFLLAAAGLLVGFFANIWTSNNANLKTVPSGGVPGKP